MSEPDEPAATPFSQPVSKKAKPSVFTTGDLVWDTHIAKLLAGAHGYHRPHLQTQLTNRYGGAWYLEKMVGLALGSVGINSPVTAPKRATREEIEENTGPGGIAKSVSVWDWFTGKENREKGAWRIGEFLGSEAADWSREPCQSLDPPAQSPTLLAIDDLGLGFADQPKAWPGFLEDPATGPDSIIAKTAPPFDRPLWKKLLQPAWAERLTIVLTASSLRDAGAKLSEGLSWDLAIEEAQRIFSSGGICWPLHFCKRVVLVFGRSGAAVFSRRPQTPEEMEEPPSELKFERFVFDPAHLESNWSADLEGTTRGIASSVAAMQVVHELLPLAPSSHLTVSRGLAAARALHAGGGGSDSDRLDLERAEKTCFTQIAEPEKNFRSAFARRLLDEPTLVTRDQTPDPSLLTDALGISGQFLAVAAEQIVRFGKDIVLKTAPHLSCGDFFTVDREEIERLNTIRNTVLDYQKHTAVSRPLSLAVFGECGSGKTFAIKQLAGSLFGKGKTVIEFNLSQFSDVDDLYEALREVRDKSVDGQIPLVFWHKFDTGRGSIDPGWLGEFLAPMQDAHFVSRGKAHPLGKCIFIFVGSSSSKFAEFESASKDKAVSGSEFVSGLSGFVNIKGPNPDGENRDEVHVIRRALLLRSLIQRHHPEVIESETGELSISPNVLTAFLKAEKYLHGANSMEAIVSLSRPCLSGSFGPSDLPPPEVAQLHASQDFSHIASSQDGITLGPAEIERLAAIMHRNWVKAKTKDGWTAGKTAGRNPEAKTDSRLVDFNALENEADKEASRGPARLTLLRLQSQGYQIVRRDLQWGEHQVDLTEESDTLEQFARSEHRRWMREKLLTGACLAEHTSDELQLHEDLRSYDHLPLAARRLDFAIARAIMDFLDEKGLTLVKGETT